MADTTHENYVTESIFVPLYNRSEGVRELISSKFGSGVKFGEHLKFTGNNKPKDCKYGYPDATSDEGNYIEIKINYGGLQPNEAEGGDENGYGYGKYLKEKNDKYLLYLIPDDYKDNFVKNKRSKQIYWSEIIEYLRKHNEYDPYITMLTQKVEGLDKHNIRSLESYKAKLYEILLMMMTNNPDISFSITEENIASMPQEIDTNDCQAVEFKYRDEIKQEYYLGVDKNEFFLLLPCEFSPFYMSEGKALFDDYYFEKVLIKKLSIISISDFWKKEVSELSEIFRKKIETYIKVYERTEKFMNDSKSIYEDVFIKNLDEYAKKHDLDFEYDEDNKTFSFQKKGEKWKYAFQFENKNDWRKDCPPPFFLRDFLFGIFYNGSKKDRKKYVKILSEPVFQDGGEWVSYKYYDEPYLHWGRTTFEELKKSPMKFIEKVIGSKMKEIDKAIESID